MMVSFYFYQKMRAASFFYMVLSSELPRPICGAQPPRLISGIPLDDGFTSILFTEKRALLHFSIRSYQAQS